jgi:hypothetical protein
MIQRFTRQFIRLFNPGLIAEEVRPNANIPDVERKTKADVRRQILGKLNSRLGKLDISKTHPTL